MKVVVLVPRRSDNGRRDRVWRWLNESWWPVHHPDLPVVEGVHNNGLFNRGAAVNTAAAAAGEWDVAIVADADSFVGPQQLTEAIGLAHDRQQVTFAYSQFCYLSRAMSDSIMRGFSGMWETGVEWTLPGTCSSMVVIPRTLWDRCGGFDEGFVGWGGEDVAMSLMLQTFGNGLQRVPGNVWHLWHPPAIQTSDAWPGRVDRYSKASYDERKMMALIRRLRREAK